MQRSISKTTYPTDTKQQGKETPMTLSTLTHQLDALGFGGFKAALQRQSEDANYAQLPFEERLHQLLEAEQNERTNRKIKRLLSLAKLKDTHDLSTLFGTKNHAALLK
jgi:hypothetical protein